MKWVGASVGANQCQLPWHFQDAFDRLIDLLVFDGICHDVSTRSDTRAIVPKLPNISRTKWMGHYNIYNYSLICFFPSSIYHHKPGIHLEQIPGRVEPGRAQFSRQEVSTDPIHLCQCHVGRLGLGKTIDLGWEVDFFQKYSTNGFRV